MRLRFAGLPHVLVYRGGSHEPWPVGEAREVTAEQGAHLLDHGGFVRDEPIVAPKITADGMVTKRKAAPKE